jgi:hypothetical protein
VRTLVVLVLWACGAQAEPEFRVTVDRSFAAEPLTGRLVVYLVREGSGIEAEPAGGPFFEDPQPMLGVDVSSWDGSSAIAVGAVGAGAARFPAGSLPAGRYRAQAVLDRRRGSSAWRDEPGNLWSAPVTVDVAEDGGAAIAAIHLDRVVAPGKPPAAPRVSYYDIESPLLTGARGSRTVISVGVVEPIGFDPDRRYPVVYEVPGFGGTHAGAARRAEWLAQAEPDSPVGRLARGAYWVVLNPEGPNGHHLFRDSPSNGPVGAALVGEVVPRIDDLLPTAPRAAARLLRGHSSGGWSTVHLALTYPETFGGAWSSAPDPLDFRAFQDVNIYTDANMYLRDDGSPRPSYTEPDGTVAMTIAQENAMETVLGPENTSGQQWDSWQAALGPAGDDGAPAALYDEAGGGIDRATAEAYRAADPAERARRDPATTARLARQRLRIIVGDADEYDLDRGVRLFAETLEAFEFRDEFGWHEVVSGATHGSVLRSPAAERLHRDMAEHLERERLLP